MDVDHHISETAFLTNESRARMVEVSKDIYAHLWVTPATKKIWDDFAANVYFHDDVELSVRNRYYLEHLQTFVRQHQDPIFINIGAGFTSYPFLIEEPCLSIEIDYQHVIDFKRTKITEWQCRGLLPPRHIEFIAADLAHPNDFSNLENYFEKHLSQRPSFVLLEGITYYLSQEIVDRILLLLRKTQTPDSLLGFEYWQPDLVHHPVFVRLENYFETRFGYKKGTYNLIEDDFLRSLNGYAVVELTDVKEQEKIYCAQTLLDDYAVGLPTNLSLLRKI